MTDETRDTAALFALGVLTPEERRAFEDRLLRDSALADLVNEYEAVAAVMSLSIEQVEVPVHLRETILQAIRDQQAGSEIVEGEVSSPSQIAEPRATPRIKSRYSPLLPWSLAACFGILSAVLFVMLKESYEERSALVSASSIENLRIVVLEAQTEELPEVSARVAWNEVTGIGVLDTIGFPGQPSEKDYQLWIFDGDNPAPVSAGVFDPSDGSRSVFRPERAIEKAAAFAVSIEDAGGNPQPSGPVILVGRAGTG